MQLFVEPGPDDKKAAKRLERLEKRLGGSTELMGAVAVVVVEDNKKRFERVVQAPATVEWKAKYGRSSEPLVESGRMKKELTTEKGIKLLTPTELRFGSSSVAEGEGRGRQITVAKAHLLQHGTKHQRKHKVLGPTLAARKEIQGIVLDELTKP